MDGLRTARQEFQFSEAVREFSPFHGDRIISGAYPASYPISIEDSFLGGKAVGAVKLTTPVHLMPRLRMVELYLHYSTRLQGIALN
jgi:hypothetical protein